LGPVKASPQTQLRLLELADLDADLARLDHRRHGLPEVAELARLEARASELKDALVVTETELGDLGREQTRAERDVDQVRTRIDRDRARVEVLGVWWEDGFAPGRADGFVDAMRDALRAYLRFAGADHLEWAPHLGTEQRLFPARP